MTPTVFGYSLLGKCLTSTFHIHNPGATPAGEGQGSGSELAFNICASQLHTERLIDKGTQKTTVLASSTSPMSVGTERMQRSLAMLTPFSVLKDHTKPKRIVNTCDSRYHQLFYERTSRDTQYKIRWSKQAISLFKLRMLIDIMASERGK